MHAFLPKKAFKFCKAVTPGMLPFLHGKNRENYVGAKSFLLQHKKNINLLQWFNYFKFCICKSILLLLTMSMFKITNNQRPRETLATD